MKTKICEHSKTDKIAASCSFVFIYLRSILQRVAKTALSPATTSCGRLGRKTYCILVWPVHAWNTSPGRFLGIIMTICSSSSLINFSILQAGLQSGMLFSSHFSAPDCRAIHVTKTTLIRLPISFSSYSSTNPREAWTIHPFPAEDRNVTPRDADPNARGESVRAALKNTGHSLIHTAWCLHYHSNPEPWDELTTRNSSSKYIYLYPHSGLSIN